MGRDTSTQVKTPTWTHWCDKVNILDWSSQGDILMQIAKCSNDADHDPWCWEFLSESSCKAVILVVIVDFVQMLTCILVWWVTKGKFYLYFLSSFEDTTYSSLWVSSYQSGTQVPTQARTSHPVACRLLKAKSASASRHVWVTKWSVQISLSQFHPVEELYPHTRFAGSKRLSADRT